MTVAAKCGAGASRWCGLGLSSCWLGVFWLVATPAVLFAQQAVGDQAPPQPQGTPTFSLSDAPVQQTGVVGSGVGSGPESGLESGQSFAVDPEAFAKELELLESLPGVESVSEVEPVSPESPYPGGDDEIAQWMVGADSPPEQFSYRFRQRRMGQVAMGQVGLGLFSFEDTGYLKDQDTSGFNFGLGIHALKGPIKPDLHPRLYDFYWTYQRRGDLGAGMSYDVSAGVGFFADFEDSVRDGVRFPGHAVVTGRVLPRLQWLFGVDYLDRDDYVVLPIAGLRWQPIDSLQLNIEIPEPMIRWQYGEDHDFYVKGRLGGGTWDIEYVNAGDDVMTLREWEILCGFRNRGGDEKTSLEFGYVIERSLEFRSGRADVNLPDAWVIRFVTEY